MAAIALVLTVLITARRKKGRRRRSRRTRGTKVDSARSHVWRRESAARVFAMIRRGEMQPGQVLAYLRKIDPLEFEEIVLLSLRSAGFTVKNRGRYTGDGGVDGEVSRSGVDYIVQCKRYSGSIAAKDVERLENECARRRCGGLFVHTGKTGKGSRQVVAKDWSRVKIISGDALVGLLTGKNLL